MPLLRSTPLALALTLAAAGTLLAHDTWLLPAGGRAVAGQPVTVDLTSGMAFPRNEFAVAQERVEHARMRAGGSTTELPRGTRAPAALRYTVRMPRPGVAALWVELRPKELELTPPKVAEYLAEIDAAPAIRRRWESLPRPRRWRESYAKHAATFVDVRDAAGRAAADGGWAAPLGMGLEIVPERSPVALKAGDTLVVRVLRAGRPYPSFTVGAVREGQARGTFHRTDAEGRTRVVLGRGGRWLLRGTDLRPATRPGLEWESDFTTLTLFVAPR